MPLSSLSQSGSSRLPSVAPPLKVSTAPAELNDQHRKMSLSTPPAKYSLDQRPALMMNRPTTMKLDEGAPARAIKSRSTSDIQSAGSPVSTRHHALPPRLHSVVEEESPHLPPPLPPGAVIQESQPREDWGGTFQIAWMSTKRVPFFRTRHIRNPWNHDREIKVSRDGTEIEPGVGQELIDQWEELAEGAVGVEAEGSSTKTTARTARGGQASRS